jgi:hypothetical protein
VAGARQGPLAHALGVAALAGILALHLAGWGVAVREGWIGDRRILEQPVGTPAMLSLRRVLAIEGPDRYVVGDATLRVPIVGPTAGLVVGKDVTIEGAVGEGVIVESARHAAPARDAKRGLGLVGLALAALVWGVGFVPTPAGWRPRWPIS